MDILGQKNYGLYKEKKLSGARYKSRYTHIRQPILCSKSYNKSKPSILVMSPFGLQTDAILSDLQKKKSQFVYINLDEFVKKGKVSFSTQNNELVFVYGKLTIVVQKLKSIYIDYFDLQEVFYFRRSDFNLKEQLFIRRWLYTLSLIESVFEDSKWYPSKPSNMNFEGQNKIAELVLASRLGLNTPASLFTNHFPEVLAFVQEHKSILKDSGLKAYYGKQSLLKFQSSYISSNIKPQITELSPVELQAHVSKRADVRAYLIGQKIYAIRIEAKSQKTRELEWKGSEKDYVFESFRIPARIEKKLIRLAQKLRYSFCSFDLLVTDDNQIVFLEMNRPGQWYFAQALSGIDLSSKIVKELRL